MLYLHYSKSRYLINCNPKKTDGRSEWGKDKTNSRDASASKKGHVLVYFTNHKIYHSRLGSSQCTSHSSDVLEQQCSIIQRTVCPPWRFKHSSLTKLYKSWDLCSYWKILCGRGVGGSGLEDASYVLEQSSVLCIKVLVKVGSKFCWARRTRQC